MRKVCFLIVLILSLVSCTKPQDLQDQLAEKASPSDLITGRATWLQDQNQSDEKVTLVIEASFSTATIIIAAPGYISYKAISRVPDKENETDALDISYEKYSNLIFFIENQSFSSFDDIYKNNIADATRFTVSVEKDKKTKSVTCYKPCPGPMNEIIKKLVKVREKGILILSKEDYSSTKKN